MTTKEYIKIHTNIGINSISQWKDTIHGSRYQEIVGFHPWLTPENAEEVAIIAKDEALNSIWKDAQGDDLPEIDREVVVFTQNFPDDAGIMRVSIAHRPNPNGWDGKSLSTGKEEHFEPKTYDNGGWNIPDVKYWLDAPLPEGIE